MLTALLICITTLCAIAIFGQMANVVTGETQSKRFGALFGLIYTIFATTTLIWAIVRINSLA